MSRDEVEANLTELLALLAHDLRNPLSAVLTNLNFLRASMLRAKLEQDEAILDSTLSCAILERLITNLDLLGRAFSVEPSRPSVVRVEPFVTDALGRARLEVQAADVEVELVPSSADLRVRVEPELFARALDNLVANAIQYSPVKGKIQVSIVAPERIVGARSEPARPDPGEQRDPGSVRIEIVDEGPIVPPELRAEVLTARGQAVSKQRFDARYGRGLGLFCASSAATLAGAQITIGERDGASLLVLAAPAADHSH